MYGITIRKNGEASAARQLADQLRARIAGGLLPAGSKLPATRKAAETLGIARNVVIDVYEQLIAEGYLEGRSGSGTYVVEGAARAAPAAAARRPQPHRLPADPIRPPSRERPGTRERPQADGQAAFGPIDMTGGLPDLAAFPLVRWGKRLKEAAETVGRSRIGYGDSFGDPALRAVLAEYLYRAKGIACEPDRVIVVPGSSGGFRLAADALRPFSRRLIVEDPTVEFGRDIFRGAGYAIVPVETDGHGIRTDVLHRLDEGDLVLATPSHQFPTGSILSIGRRLKLLAMAEEADAWVIEDDYDSEFRLRGTPVPPMQASNPDRVIYAGTFSKTLAPGLRLGFLVVPPRLEGPFRAAAERLNPQVPIIEQLALMRFIAEGDLERHIYRMRKIYRHKRKCLTDALDAGFGAFARIRGDEAGMHLLAAFEPAGAFAGVRWEDAEAHGVRVQPLDEYRLLKRGAGHEVVIGYGHLETAEIEEGVRRLHAFMDARGLLR